MDSFHFMKLNSVKSALWSMMGFGAYNRKPNGEGVLTPEQLSASQYTGACTGNKKLCGHRNGLVKKFIGATAGIVGGSSSLKQSTDSLQGERPSFLRLNSCGESSEEESPVFGATSHFGGCSTPQPLHDMGRKHWTPPYFSYPYKTFPQAPQSWAPPQGNNWWGCGQNYPQSVQRDFSYCGLHQNQTSHPSIQRPNLHQPYFPSANPQHFGQRPPFQLSGPRFYFNPYNMEHHQQHSRYHTPAWKKSPKCHRTQDKTPKTTMSNKNQNSETNMEKIGQAFEKVNISSVKASIDNKSGQVPVGKADSEIVQPVSVSTVSECSPTHTYHVYTSSHSISTCDKKSTRSVASVESLHSSPESNSFKVINFSRIGSCQNVSETQQSVSPTKRDDNVTTDTNTPTSLKCSSVVASVTGSPNTHCFCARITVAHDTPVNNEAACSSKKKKVRPSSKKRRRQKIQSGKGTVTSSPLPITLTNSQHFTNTLKANLRSDSESSNGKSPPISFVIDFSSDAESDQYPLQSSPCVSSPPMSNFSFVISAADVSSSEEGESSDSDFWDNDDDCEEDADFKNVSWDPLNDIQGMSFHITCNILGTRPEEPSKETEVEENPELVNCSAEIEMMKKRVEEANQKWNDSYESLQSFQLFSTTKVQFADPGNVDVHILDDYPEESQQARVGGWEVYARDRDRFQRHVQEVDQIIAPCLQPEHRLRVYNSRIQSN